MRLLAPLSLIALLVLTGCSASPEEEAVETESSEVAETETETDDTAACGPYSEIISDWVLNGADEADVAERLRSEASPLASADMAESFESVANTLETNPQMQDLSDEEQAASDYISTSCSELGVDI